MNKNHISRLFHLVFEEDDGFFFILLKNIMHMNTYGVPFFLCLMLLTLF